MLVNSVAAVKLCGYNQVPCGFARPGNLYRQNAPIRCFTGHSMRLTALTISGFRCFGPEPVTIRLDDVTALIGANRAGKSAVLIALSRLFGLTGDERTVVREDFHLKPEQSIDDVEDDGLQLSIEARLDFPELEVEEDEEADADLSAVPLVFRQMAVDAPKTTPYCRVRLDASWRPGNLPEGEIEQELNWITAAGDPAEVPEEKAKRPVKPSDRQHIHVHYIPSSRDPTRQLRVASRSMLKHLLDAARWSDNFKERIDEATQRIRELFDAEDGLPA